MSSSNARILLQALIPRIRLTSYHQETSHADHGSLFLGPRVCWAAGIAEYERVEVQGLAMGRSGFGHVRFGPEGEFRMPAGLAFLGAPGSMFRVCSYAWVTSEKWATHTGALVELDSRNQVTEFRYVRPREVSLDPVSFPLSPGTGVTGRTAVEAVD